MWLKLRKWLIYVPNFLFSSGQSPFYSLFIHRRSEPSKSHSRTLCWLQSNRFSVPCASICLGLRYVADEPRCENANVWLIVHCFPPSRFKLTHLFTRKLAYACLANDGFLWISVFHFQIRLMSVLCITYTHVCCVSECTQTKVKKCFLNVHKVTNVVFVVK